MPPKPHEAAAVPDPPTVAVWVSTATPLCRSCTTPDTGQNSRLVSGGRLLSLPPGFSTGFRIPACSMPSVAGVSGQAGFMVRVQHRHGQSSPCRPDQHRDAPPRMGVEPMKRHCQDCTARHVGCHATCERYKEDCAQNAKRQAYEKRFAYLDSMPQTTTALKKTLAPRRIGGQQ